MTIAAHRHKNELSDVTVNRALSPPGIRPVRDVLDVASPCAESLDLADVDIESEHRQTGLEGRHNHGKPDIPETDDCQIEFERSLRPSRPNRRRTRRLHCCHLLPPLADGSHSCRVKAACSPSKLCAQLRIPEAEYGLNPPIQPAYWTIRRDCKSYQVTNPGTSSFVYDLAHPLRWASLTSEHRAGLPPGRAEAHRRRFHHAERHYPSEPRNAAESASRRSVPHSHTFTPRRPRGDSLCREDR